MSVTSAAVSTGLAAFGAGCNASGDPPAYTPSVHTLFFVADGQLSCAVEFLPLTAIEAAITAERVKTADTLRVRVISVLLGYPMMPGRDLRGTRSRAEGHSRSAANKTRQYDSPSSRHW